MKFFLIIFILLTSFSCSTKKETYWCGDHACVSKSEKEAYFKETMIVEIRSNKKSSDIDKSDITNIEKIISNEKGYTKKKIKSSKQQRLNEKRMIKEEKRLLKQEKIKAKKIAKQLKKQEKELSKLKKAELKQMQKEKKLKNKSQDLDIKKIAKEENISKKKVNKVEIYNKDSEFLSSDFDKIVKKIMNKNNSKSYPDINNMPN